MFRPCYKNEISLNNKTSKPNISLCSKIQNLNKYQHKTKMLPKIYQKNPSPTHKNVGKIFAVPSFGLVLPGRHDGAFVQQVGQVRTGHARRLPGDGRQIHARGQVLVLEPFEAFARCVLDKTKVVKSLEPNTSQGFWLVSENLMT